MQTRSNNLFVSALFALSLTLALAMMARAQPAETPPPPAPEVTTIAEPETPIVIEAVVETVAEPEAKTANEADETPVAEPEATTTVESEVTPVAEPGVAVTVEMEVVSTGEPESVSSVESDNDDTMRRLDKAADDEMTEDGEEENISITVRRRHGPAEEFPFGDHTVPEGSTVRELVSVFGTSILNGVSERGVVSVLGATIINGKSGGEVVAVLGNMTVNGEVDGEVVTVLGDVTLGETAIVHGDMVTVGGQLHRAAGAVIHGNVQEINIFGGHDMAWLKAWIHECLFMGRPLAFGDNLGWAWSIAIGVFVAYILLALLFPRAVEKCAETLEQRPGYSMLAVLLSILMTPILSILLIATGVGILLLPLVGLGVFFGTIFGKVVIHAWLGRRITTYFGDGPMKHVAVATLLGSVLILLLYTVPFLGFFLWKVLGMLGFGVVLYTLFLTIRDERAASQQFQATQAAATPATAGATGIVAESGETTPEGTVAPPTLPVTTLPRAGFWLRIAASALDAVIVGVVVGVTQTEDFFLLWYAVYCVALWALKGTTIGGIVCGLKIVRLDERKVDWTVAIVRGLGGFLSLAVAGLGFVWVAFDKERQSWHDKIAGTIVVVSPKGGSLI